MEKNSQTLDNTEILGDRLNIAHTSSLVTGRGRGIVVETGMATQTERS